MAVMLLLFITKNAFNPSGPRNWTAKLRDGHQDNEGSVPTRSYMARLEQLGKITWPLLDKTS